MKHILRLIVLSLALSSLHALADSRVFTVVNPHPEDIQQALQKTYGDKLHVDVVRGKLLVVGNQKQLDEVAALLAKLDPIPRPLRLTVSEHPSIDSDTNAKTYSTDSGGYTVDTVEGAFVAIEYQKVVQQPTANGWWITVDNVPTQFNSLTLQVRLDSKRRAIVQVNYAKEEDQERRVFSNTVVVDLGAWIGLLPQPAAPSDGTISSGPKRGEQLYLRVDKNFK